MDAIVLLLSICLTALFIALALWLLKGKITNWFKGLIVDIAPQIISNFLEDGDTKEELMKSEKKAKAADRRHYNLEKRKTQAAMIKMAIKTAAEKLPDDHPHKQTANIAWVAIQGNLMGLEDRLNANPEAFKEAFDGLTTGNMMQAGMAGAKLMDIDVMGMVGNLVK